MSQLCTIGNFQYPYNPHNIKDLPQESITSTPTLGGGFILDFGEFVFDQQIEHKWIEMEVSFFNSLLSLRRLRTPLTLVNQDNLSYSVVMLDLTHDGLLEGSGSFVKSVNIKYQRLS